MADNLKFELQNLLSSIDVLSLKYKKLKDKNDFNIFSILKNEKDEVHLHSRFIFELLNPLGKHRLGKSFLEAFLKLVGIKEFDCENVQVHREFKNIDIFIENNIQAIIIENKIGAPDQNKQIERYYREIVNLGFKEIWIIYITLYGDEPSKTSIGDLDKKTVEDSLLQVSYEIDILNWINECIALSALHPTLRETLFQYKLIINKLTGNSMSEDETDEIINLLSKNDNILNAQKVIESWNDVRWNVEWSFWEEMEELIMHRYEITSMQKYSEIFLESVIIRKKKRNPYYGLMFEIDRIGVDRICLFIERGFHNVYYGITIVNKLKRTKKYHDKYSKLAQAINDSCYWPMEEVWLGGNYLEPEINFESFSDETTLMLINTRFRQEYIRNQWKKIEEFISLVKKEIKKL